MISQSWKYILNIINKKVSKNEMILIKLLEFVRGLVLKILDQEVVSSYSLEGIVIN
jgi:hypothetical protein